MQYPNSAPPRSSTASPSRRIRRDGWTTDRQVKFIIALHKTRSVARAAAAAGMSRESAYRLRDRPGHSDFARAWDARSRRSCGAACPEHCRRNHHHFDADNRKGEDQRSVRLAALYRETIGVMHRRHCRPENGGKENNQNAHEREGVRNVLQDATPKGEKNSRRRQSDEERIFSAEEFKRCRSVVRLHLPELIQIAAP